MNDCENTPPRVVSGHPWTIDGRWVVVAEVYGRESIVFDPDNSDWYLPSFCHWVDLQDCLKFVRENS